MNKFLARLVIVLVVLVAIGFATCLALIKTFVNPVKNNIQVKDGIIEFVGKVTDYDTGCFVDATCEVVVDNKYHIVVAAGMMPQELAPRFGMNDVSADDIGATVKVRAKLIDNSKYISIDEKGIDQELYVLKLADHFACSDYCPGPKEQNMKVIFENVTDPRTCKEIGGTPYVYTGWGNTNVCIAD